MSWDVILLPKAHEDIRQILIYLRNFYPSTPLKFDREYQRVKRQLSYNPRSWSRCPTAPDYRRAIIGKYVMLYKIDETQHQVHIHRILRGSWNLPNILED